MVRVNIPGLGKDAQILSSSRAPSFLLDDWSKTTDAVSRGSRVAPAWIAYHALRSRSSTIRS
eukprot:2162343-Heterocapsa_arctica.AAC.1